MARLTLQQATALIRSQIQPTGCEMVPLAEGLGRITASAHGALSDQPGYDQSTHDGVVIPRQLPTMKKEGYLLPLVGEIAAGDTRRRRLERETAVRIMTGGALPRNSWRVLPQELCHIEQGVVTIPAAALKSDQFCVQRRGSEIKRGQSVVPRSVRVSPFHISRLADTGHDGVEVHRRPRLSFFCSGSELIDKPEEQCHGKKVSSNRFLLSGLTTMAGAVPIDRGLVVDKLENLTATVEEIKRTDQPEIVVSTGGMGPGKYDLLEQAFVDAGGHIFFSKLRLRPGKSVLFGRLGDSLYFGLPGPPSAVQALFMVLIYPALLRLQGVAQLHNQCHALLEKEMSLKSGKSARLREASLFLHQNQLWVRPASRQGFNSYILCPARRRLMRAQERVVVYPLGLPCF